MSTVWLLPLSIAAVGAFGLAVVGRKLARELELLQRAMQPLRADRAAATAARRRDRPYR